ncbi:MAG: 3-isopropylmalate dehydratase small subunit [Desulfopila sp.]|jgi:3-isopropylmalate/(R)-2-methylmalate dehydratase small subunit|nr:3-isopropylmalate dehydratase small subunit [Desulfopila sp.]
MIPFIQHHGIVAPLDRANIDTDLIIPKQFLKSVRRTGFGPHLFDQLRYLDEGRPEMDNDKRPLNHDFILNQPAYRDATILLTRENFGCGSSREHAPWALLDFGIRAIIAPSFADIFYNNCFKNGILPIILDTEIIDRLFREAASQPGLTADIDLTRQSIVMSTLKEYSFPIDDYQKRCLLEGLDDIDMTLKSAGRIDLYEQQRRQAYPWLFNDLHAKTSIAR